MTHVIANRKFHSFSLFVFNHKKLHVQNYIQRILGYSEFRNDRLTTNNMITNYFLRDSILFGDEVFQDFIFLLFSNAWSKVLSNAC